MDISRRRLVLEAGVLVVCWVLAYVPVVAVRAPAVLVLVLVLMAATAASLVPADRDRALAERLLAALLTGVTALLVAGLVLTHTATGISSRLAVTALGVVALALIAARVALENAGLDTRLVRPVRVTRAERRSGERRIALPVALTVLLLAAGGALAVVTGYHSDHEQHFTTLAASAVSRTASGTHVVVQVRNDEQHPMRYELRISFDGQDRAPRTFALHAGQQRSFGLTAQHGQLVTVRLARESDPGQVYRQVRVQA